MNKTALNIILPIIFSLVSITSLAQVNGYAEVTAINGLAFGVSNEDETYDTFTANEQVLIFQMQDNVLGNTSNSSNFGSLGSILSIGLYEIRKVDYVVRSGGNLDSVVFAEALNNSYNINSNAAVQLITFPTLDDGGGDFTTTASISAVNWDGNIGGVVAFNVDGILTLAHDITADNSGFRGAGANGGSSTGCTPNGNYRVTSQANLADKGEGIYLNTTANYVAGRGKILNGGGGGNSHNAGGAGGGNYTAGGDGGPGWVCSPVAGGIGGIALSTQISASRVFMGGGGGSGEGNNGSATGGGDGGGIILIKANTLVTTGTCGGITISANGESITTGSSNDGSGGAGGAGSIILQIDSFSVSATCDLTAEASGGDGGTVGSGAQHGGGGGGGQGVIIYSATQPTTNVTSTTNNGNGGCNNNSNPCTNQASGGSGTNGGGVIDSTTGPLPITLLFFDAQINGDVVELSWSTISEINNDYFLVEKSINHIDWELIGKRNGAGNSRKNMQYSMIDNSPSEGISYYRLKQVDYNGEYETFKSVAINFSEINQISDIFPIPVVSTLHVKNEFISDQVWLRIFDISGRIFFDTSLENSGHEYFEIDVEKLKNGVFLLQIQDGDQAKSYKFMK